MRIAIRTLLKPLALAALAVPFTSLAVLQRQGPVDPAHGFPAWYQDRNGIALELCTINAPDPVVSGLLVNAGLCAIANSPAPLGVQNGPEVFPTNFATEHFYTLVSARIPTAGVVTANGQPRVVVNMGLEGSFSNNVPTAGTQITFNRWRVQHFGVACSGDHTYYTPNNVPQTYPAVAGDRVFVTFDAGLTNPGDVLLGTTGPFLQWSDVPGGLPRAPFLGPDGKRYLSDTTLTWPLTGSILPNALLNSGNALVPADIKAMPMTNYVAVMGPGVADGNCAQTQFVSTTLFSLFGRYFEGAIASRKSFDRATYRAIDTNNDGKPDTFQIGTWATATREANAAQPQMSSRLWYTDPANPATTSAELAMTGMAGAAPAVPAGVVATPEYKFFEGMTAPVRLSGTALLPAPVFTNGQVRLLTDTPPSVTDRAMVDEVRITQAAWNSTARTLTVAAESGAALQATTPAGGTATNAICSVPCLQLDNFGLPLTDAANAAIDFKLKTATTATAAVATVVIPNVQTPPAYIRVTSSSGGEAREAVRIHTVVAPAAALNPDSVSIPSGTPVLIDVFANDIGVAATPNLQICTAATAGTCAVPSATTACVAGTASPQCTALGGRMTVSGNAVQYVPPVNRAGITDTFWYQATTAAGTAARAQVSVAVTTVAGAPDARDDSAIAVTGRPVTVDVLANDFAPAGVNTGSLRITLEPCNLTTGSCSPGTANFTTTPGKLVFTPPSAGNWNLAYTFTDNAGVVADQGLVAVTAQVAQSIAIKAAKWNVGQKVIDSDGTSTIANVAMELWANPAGATNGCNAVGTGTRLATTTTDAGGAWKFVKVPAAAQPAGVYVYSPAFGGCASQSPLQ